MSGLGKTVIKKIGEREVVCRELSVAAVRTMLQAGTGTDLVTEALFEDVRLADMELFTSLTEDDVSAMLPSELRQVVDGCREANPDFFAMLARLSKAPRTA